MMSLWTKNNKQKKIGRFSHYPLEIELCVFFFIFFLLSLLFQNKNKNTNRSEKKARTAYWMPIDQGLDTSSGEGLNESQTITSL